MTSLPKATAFRDKVIGRFRVECEHVKMVWHAKTSTNFMGQTRCFNSIKVSGNAPLRFVAVNRQQSHVNALRSQRRNQAVMQDSVAAMVHIEIVESGDISQEPTAAAFVPLDRIVRRG